MILLIKIFILRCSYYSLFQFFHIVFPEKFNPLIFDCIKHFYQKLQNMKVAQFTFAILLIFYLIDCSFVCYKQINIKNLEFGSMDHI